MAYAFSREAMHKGLNVFGQLPVASGWCESSVATDPRSGLSVRARRDFDITLNQFITRFDILGGKA